MKYVPKTYEVTQQQLDGFKSEATTTTKLTCHTCHKEFTAHFTQPQLQGLYNPNKKIQDILPDWPADLRELVRGTCPVCWDYIFGPPPSDKEDEELEESFGEWFVEEYTRRKNEE